MQDFQTVMDLIQPEQVGNYWFRGNSPQPQGRIFGGQVLAQCLLAANATVETSLIAHSMHAYFLRAGDPESPIEFEVDPIRNGRSFSTRRVVARQHNRAIFNTSISYQVKEEGLSHSEPMPDITPPAADSTAPDDPEQAKMRYNLLDLYQVDRRRIKGSADQSIQQNWFRVKGHLNDDQRLHQAALALISDFSLLGTAFHAQGVHHADGKYMAASLDHAIWFHAPIDVTDFMLYQCDSPWAGNARGFNRGRFWSSSGTLLASTTQEGLMRRKTSK